MGSTWLTAMRGRQRTTCPTTAAGTLQLDGSLFGEEVPAGYSTAAHNPNM
jgi:hypothetical protein